MRERRDIYALAGLLPRGHRLSFIHREPEAHLRLDRLRLTVKCQGQGKGES
jgi:hypothetical protein